jgi:F-type H+-transporting ATPase subunit b
VPALIGGIELTTNGQKVAWSIADYLDSLEKGVDELLKEKDKPEAKPKPEAKTKPKPRTKTKSMTRAKTKPMPRTKIKSKPEAKTKPKLEDPKPETISQ